MNRSFTLVICCMFAVLVVAGCVPQSFADGFQPPLFKWAYKPVICVIEPVDPQFPGLGQKMFTETRNAALDWQTKLNGGNAKGAWNLNLVDIQASRADSYDKASCDITVNFEPSPTDPNEKFNEAGVTVYKAFPKVPVTIYYLGVNLREQYKTFWQNGTLYYTYEPIPYFTGYLASDPQLEMTIRHELGHALGLGHYIVSDMEIGRIVQGYQDMPSIMVTTVFAYGVTHFDITQLDIKEVQSIYGTAGLPPKPAQPVIANIPQNAIPTEPDNTAHNTADNPASSNATNQAQAEPIPTKLPPWIKNIARWWSSGKVSNSEFAGAMGYLIEQGVLKVPNTQGAVDSNSIPSWVTTNAGYWADGKISDYEFVRAVQYLVSTGIIRLS